MHRAADAARELPDDREPGAFGDFLTAWDTSERRFLLALLDGRIERRLAGLSATASSANLPTANVYAESATKPSSVTPTSADRMSPIQRVVAWDAVDDHLVRERHVAAG